MSDFVNEFWHWYVVVIVLVSIIGCAVLLWAQSLHRPASNKVESTGHVWDETLQEYNNPLPRWWMWMFYLTVVFSLVYLALYPGLGHFRGALGWTSAGQHEAEVAKVDAQVKPLFDKYQQMDLRAVAADAEALEMGKRLYLTYCMQCHGSDARGAKGFPNLADKDWQWGGEPERIKETILGGRYGVMPEHSQLGEETIRNIATYVRSLSGLPGDPARVAKGREAFNASDCTACHGPDGKGNQMLGAPNLTDKIWLYGGSEATIVETITKGRNNQMPAWQEFLGEGKVHLLAAYVYSLSNTPEKR
ncbi:cytochrome-c oxidase, cbb3-type subunit III [Rhodocyclus tenuis]|uniref:cytochrome-c oxidase, cbb3-type subunit III n=1 Tax=Rhodocyclus tenuis TaxID=1066 RepID=UPI001906D8C0|nr:cytochrome-c oxidase, cbb3-type subunit III [Rhodocyclus tenuis]MBK1680024.1 cytochrome-c oxidase, cbb3-type subunit III [Rhodocyclus tenuis]